VTNFAAEPDSVSIVVTYDGGAVTLPPLLLQPMQSTTVKKVHRPSE
jgi:hypothetical protein